MLYNVQNHCVERMWVEINTRVNYPIKTCLISLQRSGDIDLDCPYQKFCISWFSLRVANVGTRLAVQSWNEHTIPGVSCLLVTYLLHTIISLRSWSAQSNNAQKQSSSNDWSSSIARFFRCRTPVWVLRRAANIVQWFWRWPPERQCSKNGSKRNRIQATLCRFQSILLLCS